MPFRFRPPELHGALPRFGTLQLAVIAALALALVIPGIAGYLIESRRAERQAQAELQLALERTGNLLSASLAGPLWDFSRPTAEAIVRAVATDSHFVSVIVTEADGKRVFVELHRQAGLTEGIARHREPIRHGGQEIGAVEVTMTLEPYLNAARARLTNNVVQLTVVLFVALAAMFFVLRRKLLIPIGHLTREAHRLADENLAAPITLGGADELGRVAAAMEHMRRRLLETFGELQEKNQQLIEHAITLETRVQERTNALSVANHELTETLRSLRATQASLIEAEKLASLGRLVAGVAHELNTPIGNAVTIISAMAERDEEFRSLIGSGTIRRSQLEDYARRIEEGHTIAFRNLKRAAEIILDFKQLAIDQTTDMRRSFDVDKVIDEVLTTIQPSFKHTPHAVLTELQPGIRMDSFPGPLGQVITNMALNALAHAFADTPAGTVRITCARDGADHVRITCSDNGCGMDEATLHRIFDPFFTTKLGKGGSGLGMHIVHNIVTGLLGGRIEVHSAPGEGSRFTITVPLVAPRERVEETIP